MMLRRGVRSGLIRRHYSSPPVSPLASTLPTAASSTNSTLLPPPSNPTSLPNLAQAAPSSPPPPPPPPSPVHYEPRSTAPAPTPATSATPVAPTQPEPTPVSSPAPPLAKSSSSSGGRRSGGGGGFRSAFWSTTILLGTGAFLFYASDSRAGVHRWVVTPSLIWLTKDDPEKAHEWAIKFLSSGLAPVDKTPDNEDLAVEVWGKKFSSPIGIAAGFDKNGEAIDGLFGLGFSYVEIGSITPEPQPGNPKPRVFRVPEHSSIINRYGFNSQGHLSVLSTLRSRITTFIKLHSSSLPPSLFPLPPPNAPPTYSVVTALLSSPSASDAKLIDTLNLPRSLHPNKILGINLGKNKSSDPDSIEDFVEGVKKFGPLADILVVNVSSPNTPGLRSLQRKGMIEELLRGVIRARDGLSGEVKPPILIKIAPDLSPDELADLAAAAISTSVDGIIVSNTTLSRPSPSSSLPILSEAGGFSGPPLKSLSLSTLRSLSLLTEGKIPLVGCGGITSGADAVEFAKAGASLVQLYTAMVWEGVGIGARLKKEVGEALKGKKWSEVVGEEGKERRRKHEEELERIREEVAKEGRERVEIKWEEEVKEVQEELEKLLAELEGVDPLTKKITTLPPVLEIDSTPISHASDVSHQSDLDASTEIVPVVNALAIPANAVLSEENVLALLDPGREQVASGLVGGVVEKKEEEEKKRREDEEKVKKRLV